MHNRIVTVVKICLSSKQNHFAKPKINFSFYLKFLVRYSMGNVIEEVIYGDLHFQFGQIV